MPLRVSQPVSATGPCPRVLVVDDRTDSVALLLDYFEGQALEVMVALDGPDGIRKAAAGRPDAILLDVSMLGMDGYAVCRALKADPRTAAIPVVFLSAATSLADKLEGFAAGGVDYIAKPFSSEEVLARLFVHLRLSQPAWRLSDERRSEAREASCLTAAVAELQRQGAGWPGLEALARSVGTNEKRLTELFRKHLGMTAWEYLIELRLEAARAELARADTQIQLIADRAGYRNASDFSRAFRRRYGVGPRQYRRAGAGAPAALAIDGVDPDAVECAL